MNNDTKDGQIWFPREPFEKKLKTIGIYHQFLHALVVKIQTSLFSFQLIKANTYQVIHIE